MSPRNAEFQNLNGRQIYSDNYVTVPAASGNENNLLNPILEDSESRDIISIKVDTQQSQAGLRTNSATSEVKRSQHVPEKPPTASKKTLKSSKSQSKMLSQRTEQQDLEAKKQFLKHVSRMEQARVNTELKKVVEDLKPGSGKIWKNQLTKPSVPKITGIKQPKNNGDIDTIYSRPKQRIKSLERPITPAYSAHNIQKKRHNVYNT